MNSREYSIVTFSSNSATRDTPSSFLVRMVMRISRARWFNFLRRVFHYQNGSSSNLGSNPFNSSTWMMLEFITLVVQITIITFTLAISERERSIWPMRIWISGYDIGCILNFLLLIHLTQGNAQNLSDMEQQRNNEETRYAMHFNLLSVKFIISVLTMDC